MSEDVISSAVEYVATEHEVDEYEEVMPSPRDSPCTSDEEISRGQAVRGVRGECLNESPI